MARGIRDRVDGDGEVRDATELAAALNRPISRGIMRLLGIDSSVTTELRSIADRVEVLFSDVELAAKVLPSLGWVPYAGMPVDFYADAARLAAQGDDEGAENTLVDGWNEGNRLLHALQRLKTLGAGGEPLLHAHFLRRWELLERAREHHEAGRYEASVLLVLSQMDGIVIDITESKKQNFFSGGDHLADDETLAGHPEGLQAVARVFGRDVKATGNTGELARHGIVHGRELGYDTKLNSTKAFAALFALIEWAQPVMRARSDAWLAAEELRNAGSDGVDADGRRLDRREFDVTKSVLRWIGTCQMGRYNNTGEYEPGILDTLEERLAADLDTDHGVHLTVTSDGQKWWAWRRTVSGWVFAIGSSEGTPNQWMFDGPEPPDEAPGDDSAWGEPPMGSVECSRNW